MLDLSQYQQIIFDFDGVILDSNQIKSNAFSNSLIDEDKELVKLFIAFHKKNGGISRFKKFDYFFNTIKNQKTYQKTTPFQDVQKSQKSTPRAPKGPFSDHFGNHFGINSLLNFGTVQKSNFA